MNHRTAKAKSSWCRVLPGGAAEGQLAPGDVIVEVNGAPVQRAEDVVARAKSTPRGSPVLLKIKRDGKTRYVAIERSPR